MEINPVPPLPTFTTARLVLRPRTMTDLEACLAMDRDPLVTQFIPGPWRDPIAHRAFVEARIRHVYPPGMGYWCIFTPAGFFVAFEDLQGPEIEMGWRLIRPAWGQGFAAEAARPVFDHTVYTHGLRRIIADIHPANEASAGVARKLGFLPAGAVQHEGWTMIRHVVEVTAP